MKYFIDVQFGSGLHKPLIGRPKQFLDFISIAIIAQDGRTYTAMSNEYQYKSLDSSTQNLVIHPLFMYSQEVFPSVKPTGTPYEDSFQKDYGKPVVQIVDEIIAFIAEKEDKYLSKKDDVIKIDRITSPITFYDTTHGWSLFTSMFVPVGRFPPGIPTHSHSLVQMLDMEAEAVVKDSKKKAKVKDLTFAEAMTAIKAHPQFPKMTSPGHILKAAECNRQLYEMLS